VRGGGAGAQKQSHAEGKSVGVGQREGRRAPEKGDRDDTTVRGRSGRAAVADDGT